MDSKPFPSSSFNYSPLYRKKSPRRVSAFEEYKEEFMEKYSQMLPMQGLTSTRSRRPNPLQIYYKNIDVVRPRKIETERNKRVHLPQIRRNDFHDQDETLIHHQHHSSAIVETDSNPYKDALNQTENAENPPPFHQESPRNESALFKKAKPVHKIVTKDGIEVRDYADLLMKREYGNYEKRTKKMVSLRLQNFNNARAKSWAKYLGTSKIKPQIDDILLQTRFMTPRNEYPILN